MLGFGFCGCMTSLIVGFLGFLGFVYSLDRFEQKPETRADGIVAMTGGAQRIGDAIDLLAQGYAKRLLISGVNEKTSREEIARLNPGPAAAVRLLRGPRLPGPQHHRQRHRDPALGRAATASTPSSW